MNTGGPRKRPSLFYRMEQQQPEHQEHDDVHRALQHVGAVAAEGQRRDDERDGEQHHLLLTQAQDGGRAFQHAETSTAGMVKPIVASTEPSAILIGALQAISQGGLQRAHRLRRQHQHGDAGQSRRRGSTTFTACSTMWPSSSVR